MIASADAGFYEINPLVIMVTIFLEVYRVGWLSRAPTI